MMTMRINHVAVAVAAVVTFILAGLYYSPLLFGGAYMKLSSAAAAAAARAPHWLVIEEVLRHLVIAYVVALLVRWIGAMDWRGGVKLGVWLWIGFPVTLLGGAAMWEGVPWQLAMLHAGDWLMKLVLMSVILAAWRAPVMKQATEA